MSVPVIERINSLKKLFQVEKNHTHSKISTSIPGEQFANASNSSGKEREEKKLLKDVLLPDLLACGLCPPYWVARAPGCDRAPRAPDSFIKVGVGERERM